MKNTQSSCEEASNDKCCNVEGSAFLKKRKTPYILESIHPEWTEQNRKYYSNVKKQKKNSNTKFIDINTTDVFAPIGKSKNKKNNVNFLKKNKTNWYDD